MQLNTGRVFISGLFAWEGGLGYLSEDIRKNPHKQIIASNQRRETPGGARVLVPGTTRRTGGNGGEVLTMPHSLLVGIFLIQLDSSLFVCVYCELRRGLLNLLEPFQPDRNITQMSLSWVLNVSLWSGRQHPSVRHPSQRPSDEENRSFVTMTNQCKNNHKSSLCNISAEFLIRLPHCDCLVTVAMF